MNRSNITHLIKEQTAMQVQKGPFAGMLISDENSWGDGDLAPKLLGTYEQELHLALSEFASRSYGAIVDIGCAEGFYAVGLARLFTGTKVYAFDSDPRACATLATNAAANGTSNIEVGGTCGTRDLLALAQAHGKVLLICDCEGFEVDLFSDPATQDRLREELCTSDLIIECHDFINPISTAICFAVFGRTHTIEIVRNSGRNPSEFGFLNNVPEIERWLAVSENRPCVMHWVVCRARRLQK